MMHLFYRLDPGADPPPLAAAVAGLEVELWHPSLTEARPRGATGKVFVAWWAFHYLRVFSNRDYSQLVMYRNSRLVHRSGVYPGYLRFPFMAPQDLQIGDTWTDPDLRGQGLAVRAIVEIVRRFRAPGRSFWYVVEQDNLPSVHVIQHAGFDCVGQGARAPRLGIHVLGKFVLTEAPSPEWSEGNIPLKRPDPRPG